MEANECLSDHWSKIRSSKGPDKTIFSILFDLKPILLPPFYFHKYTTLGELTSETVLARVFLKILNLQKEMRLRFGPVSQSCTKITNGGKNPWKEKESLTCILLLRYVYPIFFRSLAENGWQRRSLDAIQIAQTQYEAQNIGQETAHQLIDASKDILALFLDSQVSGLSSADCTGCLHTVVQIYSNGPCYI